LISVTATTMTTTAAINPVNAIACRLMELSCPVHRPSPG
jgi:NAD-dependent dihydropyrimidine dehydrogenase PreA subunit